MSNEPRLYGTADGADRPSPAPQGLRGEKTSNSVQDPEFSHAVTLDSGKRVVVSEGNGVAYAEATGRVARAEPQPEPAIDVAPQPAPAIDSTPGRASRTPLLVGALAVGAAAGLYLVERYRRSQPGDASLDLETERLVPERQLPHQLPFTSEISPSASQTSASSDRSRRSPDI